MKAESVPQILSLKEIIRAPRKLGHLNLLSKRPSKNSTIQRKAFQTQGRNRYRFSGSNMLSAESNSFTDKTNG